jgi:hypothetical protein
LAINFSVVSFLFIYLCATITKPFEVSRSSVEIVQVVFIIYLSVYGCDAL